MRDFKYRDNEMGWVPSTAWLVREPESKGWYPEYILEYNRTEQLTPWPFSWPLPPVKNLTLQKVEEKP